LPTPQQAGNLKFTMYVPLVQKMHHIKFEKNWSSGYQVEVKNLQMLRNTIYHVWPHPGDKNATPRIINFTILVEAFLHHHAFSFSSTCVVVEKIFENWSILGNFCPAPKAIGDRDHEIHNFRSPSPIDAISQIWLKLVQWFQRRS
jgi:hypothetical protein